MLFAVAAASADAAGEGDVTGWWRATLHHAEEREDIYLHLVENDQGLSASFSNLTIGATDSPLGRAIATDHAVELRDVGWTLVRESGGAALTGVIPETLIPYYRIRARFERSSTPPLLQPPARAEPARKPVWQRSVGAPVYGGIAFDPVTKLLVIGTDAGRVFGLRAATGQIAWATEGGAPIRATPVVSGRAVYVATDKALLKLNSRTGRRLWSASLGEPKHARLEITDANSRWDHYSSSPVIARNVVYVGSRDGCVYRFKSANGVAAKRICANDSITATPVVDDHRVYFGSFDGHVYAANLNDGRVVWKWNAHGPVPRDLALADGNILAGSRSFDLTALKMATGTPAWTRYFWFSWVDSPPSVSGRTIYVGSSDSLRVFALDARSGARVWASRLPGWAWARPAVGSSAVYAGAVGTTKPYIGERQGAFAAIDRANGRLRWLFEPPHPNPAVLHGFASDPVIAIGRVYAADLSGTVYAFDDR